MKMLKYTPAALALLLLAACSGKKDADATKAQKDDNIPTVRVEQVDERDVPQIRTYTATVEPYLINNISAQMSLSLIHI